MAQQGLAMLLGVLMLQGVSSQAPVGSPARVPSNRSLLSLGLLQQSGFMPSQAPLGPGGAATEVQVQFALINIVDVSTEREHIELQGWWRMYWKDPSLTWDREAWNVPYLTFKRTEIWTPDVTIFEQISQQETSVSTMVYPDGSVIMSVPRVTRVGCSMNLTDYPFDRQFCKMTLGSWAYTSDIVDVVPRKVNASQFWLNSETRTWANATTAPMHAAVDLRDFSAQANKYRERIL